MAEANREIISSEYSSSLRGNESGDTGGTGGIAEQAVSPPPESAWGRLFQDALETLLLAVVLFVAVRTTLQNTRVDGHSMEPTLHNGQYLMVNKLVYKFGDPQRGDIVVFHSPQDEKRALIKRVVGLPGEEVVITAGQVYVNGQPLSEPYISSQHAAINWGPRLLGADEYLVLGDNRDNSNDSRSFGPVRRAEIIGKAWFSLWPPNYGLTVPHYNTSAIGAETAAP